MKIESQADWLKRTTVCLIMTGLTLACLGQTPPNDNFANRIFLTGTNVLTSGNNVGASKQSSEPNHAGNAGGRSVWWTWTAPSNGMATVATTGSSFDTLLGVYTGNAVSGLSYMASSDDEGTGVLTSRTKFWADAGQAYHIAVDGYDGDYGSIMLQIVLNTMTIAAPWTMVNASDGSTLRSTNFAGKVVILDFWATWCGPCKAEIPDFISLQNQYGPDGLVIVGASVDTLAYQDVRTFGLTNGINYVLAMSNSAMLSNYGGISAIPTTFIIDRHNNIRQYFVGTKSRATFEKAILPLLYQDLQVKSRVTGGKLELVWPNTGASFIVETKSRLEQASWSTNCPSSILTNGQRCVTLPLTGTQGYYRLRLR